MKEELLSMPQAVLPSAVVMERSVGGEGTPSSTPPDGSTRRGPMRSRRLPLLLPLSCALHARAQGQCETLTRWIPLP